MKRFLIGQLACFGDCLYATTVAKQIKHDYPDSHITWAVATRYKSILDMNPLVDELWEIPLVNNDYYDIGWKKFEAEAQQKKAEGIYDELVFTQLAQQHWVRYDGTIRSATLRGYEKPITVSVDPVIRLREDEIARVSQFANNAKLESFKEVILFEYSPGSGQSFITAEFALKVAEVITVKFNDVCFVFSGPKPLLHPTPQIIDASSLTFRENAELTKHCTLLIGCSSGITWLSTSDWAKKLKMVQLLNKEYQFFAGVKYDYEYWNLPSDGVIEITVNNINHVVSCIDTILAESFEAAKKSYDEVYRPEYFNFVNVLTIVIAMYNGKVAPVLSLISAYHQRNKHLALSRLTYYGFRELGNVYRGRIRLALKRIVYKPDPNKTN